MSAIPEDTEQNHEKLQVAQPKVVRPEHEGLFLDTLNADQWKIEIRKQQFPLST